MSLYAWFQLFELTRDPSCRYPWCTRCCWSKQGKQFGHNRPELDWSIRMGKEKEISFLRRFAAANGPHGTARLVSPEEFERLYPAICQHMTVLTWPNGGDREVSTLTFSMEDGKLKGCVNDRANEASLWRSGDTIEEVLACLEAALEDNKSTWRRWARSYRKK
jgi:hypothetical protein